MVASFQHSLSIEQKYEILLRVWCYSKWFKVFWSSVTLQRKTLRLSCFTFVLIMWNYEILVKFIILMKVLWNDKNFFESAEYPCISASLKDLMMHEMSSFIILGCRCGVRPITGLRILLIPNKRWSKVIWPLAITALISFQKQFWPLEIWVLERSYYKVYHAICFVINTKNMAASIRVI